MSRPVLSEESVFIAENWDVVREIVQGADRLGNELKNFLLSLEADLRPLSWWGDGGSFDRWGSAQVYVSRESWRAPNGFALEIGIDGFSADRVFGDGDPPCLFVWARDLRLAEKLSAKLATRSIRGELDPKSTYFVRQLVPKCPVEEAEAYFATIRKQFAEFLAFYTSIADEIEPTIAQHLASTSRQSAN